LITEEHLEHWLKEIKYQLNGISGEINPEKVVLHLINVGKSGEAVVSFDYLNEKKDIIRVLIKNIEFDMRQDV